MIQCVGAFAYLPAYIWISEMFQWHSTANSPTTTFWSIDQTLFRDNMNCHGKSRFTTVIKINSLAPVERSFICFDAKLFTLNVGQQMLCCSCKIRMAQKLRGRVLDRASRPNRSLMEDCFINLVLSFLKYNDIMIHDDARCGTYYKKIFSDLLVTLLQYLLHVRNFCLYRHNI